MTHELLLVCRGDAAKHNNSEKQQFATRCIDIPKGHIRHQCTCDGLRTMSANMLPKQLPRLISNRKILADSEEWYFKRPFMFLVNHLPESH